MKVILSIVIIVTIVGVFAAYAFANTDGPESTAGRDMIGTKWPNSDFDAWYNVENPKEILDNAKVLLFRWWTDTCPYCEASLPAVQQLREEYGGQGLETVAVYHPKPPRDVDKETILGKARSFGYDGPIALDQDWSFLRDFYLSKNHRRATSVTFVVDGSGVIQFVHPGPVYFPSDDPTEQRQNRDFEDLEQAVRALLSQEISEG